MALIITPLRRDQLKPLHSDFSHLHPIHPTIDQSTIPSPPPSLSLTPSCPSSSLCPTPYSYHHPSSYRKQTAIHGSPEWTTGSCPGSAIPPSRQPSHSQRCPDHRLPHRHVRDRSPAAPGVRVIAVPVPRSSNPVPSSTTSQFGVQWLRAYPSRPHGARLSSTTTSERTIQGVPRAGPVF